MFTPAQLRAARGLLDWTRNDLADHAGISPETIKNIEHGTFRPQESTARAIVSCFKRFDIEFTDNDGVRRTKDTVVHYLGQDGFHDYVNDVYTELQRLEDKVIRICGVEDRLFVKALGNKADEHLKRMNSLQGLHFKAIASDINKSMKLGYIEYRTIPNLSFQIQFSVYGDRYDFILFGETKDYPKVVAIRSKIVAQAYREQFDALWNIAQKDG